MLTHKEQFLLFRIRSYKDRKAFDEIHLQYQVGIYRFLRSRLPSDQDADDASDETFMRLWNYLLVTPTVESVSGLVYTIARNLIAGFYRNRTIDFSLDAEEGEAIRDTDHGTGSRQIEAQMDLQLIRKFLQEECNEEQRMAFTMRYFDGRSVKEISKAMEKTENGISVLIYRVKHKLQTHFDAYDRQRTHEKNPGV